MTKELAQQIVDILKGSKDFATEQMPDVVQQYLHFSHVVRPIALVFCIIMLSICIKVCIGLRNVDDIDDMKLREALKMFFCAVGAFSFSVALIVEINANIMLFLTPKVYVLEWLKGFIN